MMGGYGGAKREPPNIEPTLAEMGLDKKTSKLAQDIAKLPEAQFEAVKKGVATLNEAQKEVMQEKKAEQRAELYRNPYTHRT